MKLRVWAIRSYDGRGWSWRWFCPDCVGGDIGPDSVTCFSDALSHLERAHLAQGSLFNPTVLGRLRSLARRQR